MCAWVVVVRVCVCVCGGEGGVFDYNMQKLFFEMLKHSFMSIIHIRRIR